MPKIPKGERAVVEFRKLRDYCLNLNHDESQHKARLFAAALGLTANEAEELQEALLQAARTQEAELGRLDTFGQRYRIDFLFRWRGREAGFEAAGS